MHRAAYRSPVCTLPSGACSRPPGMTCEGPLSGPLGSVLRTTWSRQTLARAPSVPVRKRSLQHSLRVMNMMGSVPNNVRRKGAKGTSSPSRTSLVRWPQWAAAWPLVPRVRAPSSGRRSGPSELFDHLYRKCTYYSCNTPVACAHMTHATRHKGSILCSNKKLKSELRLALRNDVKPEGKRRFSSGSAVHGTMGDTR